MKMLRVLLLALIPFTAIAQDQVSSYERMKNFGIVYGAQWTLYILTQKPTIEDHGSFDHWIHYPSSPHFDNDSFDYNIFRHSLVGASYFLFYRSQGYQKVDAFLWSIISSAAFEFTIETVTERPSWQDLYQTPVYGTLLGLGLETVSDKFTETNTWWGKTLGVITNPFRLLKKDDEKKEALYPIYSPGKFGVAWTKEFE
ncbi:MAG: DUF3943 domain-containing protein [Bacteriovoracaceae bacterium]